MQVLLVTLERRVASHGPSVRVVGESSIGADVIEPPQCVGHRRFFEPAEPGKLIQAAIGTSLLACAVVRAQNDDRVFQPADLSQIACQPADLGVGVLEKTGVGRLEINEEALLLVGQGLPGSDSFVARRELGSRRHNAELLLSGQSRVTNLVPAFLEDRNIFVDIRFCHLVWRVGRPERQVKEKRLLGCDRGLVADVGDGVVDQVFREMIAWPCRWLDAGIVLHELGVNLVGHPVEKSIEALESRASGQ